MFRNLSVVALLTVSIVACGKSLTAPSPPPVVVDSIRIVNVNTPVGVLKGGAMQCGQYLHVTVEYTAKVHPSANGPLLVGVSILDDDTQILAGAGKGANSNGLVTQVTISVEVQCDSPVTMNFVLAELFQVAPLGGPTTIHATDLEPFILRLYP